VEAPETIARLFTDLYNLMAEEFLDEIDLKSSQTGLSRPIVSLQLKGQGGISLGEVHFGKIEGDKIYASSSQHTPVFLLDKRELDRLPREADLFPSPEAASDTAAEATTSSPES
jgi:hypothetical protein